MSVATRAYGWVRDTPDPRDLVMDALDELRAIRLPKSVDLRSQFPAAYDQGQLGSCTGNAIAAAIQFEQRKQGLPDFMPSRLMIYYGERELEGTVKVDNGAAIRDGIKVVNSQGVCAEDLWPYDVARFADKPSDAAYQAAALHKAVRYQRVRQTAADIKGCLAAGFPIVFGFIVYEAFESPAVADSGVLNLPGPNELCYGGHAVLAVGYDETDRLIVRNSWSKDWGQEGYFTMPLAYATNPQLASDFWSIRLLSA